MEYEDTLRKIESYIVPKIDKQLRLSDFFTLGIFTTITSRKAMKNAIKKGLVKVNGDIGYTGDYIRGGECIDIYRAELQTKKPSIHINIEVIYEDDYLAIVNKPCGIVVSGNKRWTLENALANNLKKSTKADALERPEPIHRLDYPTSGALLVGKTSQAVNLLNKLFEERNIEKTYTAITIGEIKDEGTINTSIENKTAKTIFKIVDRLVSPKYEFLNLTALTPYTGRMHQLRIHMSAMGNPIFGDLKYGKEGYLLKGKGLYLHASSLRFIHPFTNAPLYINVPLPIKFLKLFPEANNEC
jgi:23S rRNA pseudouridine1911/1915/1917 synthase